MAEKAFLVDTTKCLGCRACQVACKQWNGNPALETGFFEGTEYTNPKELSAITWNHVMFYAPELKDSSMGWSIRHIKCNHCRDANCVRVCPEKAIYKEAGWTIIDQEKCIGCGSCVKACVYNVPHLADRDYGGYRPIKKGRAYKCHACIINPRTVPACVQACPGGALVLDFRVRILGYVKKRLKNYRKIYPQISVYGLEQFGGLNVITILKDKPEKYGLEVNPKPVDRVSINRVNGLYKILSIYSLGNPSIKKTMHKISRSIIKNG